jgi:hypothetical protein
MKILLLILAGISMLMLVSCSKDDSYIIIGCGGLVEESDYFKEQPKPEDHDLEHKPNEFTKTSDPGIQ